MESHPPKKTWIGSIPIWFLEVRFPMSHNWTRHYDEHFVRRVAVLLREMFARIPPTDAGAGRAMSVLRKIRVCVQLGIAVLVM